MACSGFSLRLAFHNCTGCPWSRINPEILPEQKNLLFTNTTVSKDCLVANAVDGQWSEDVVLGNIMLNGFYGSVMLSSISLLGAFSGYTNGLAAPVPFFGWKLSEELYQLSLWMAFVYFNVTSAHSTVYFMICDSVSSYSAHLQLKAMAYGTTLIQ